MSVRVLNLLFLLLLAVAAVALWRSSVETQPQSAGPNRGVGTVVVPPPTVAMRSSEPLRRPVAPAPAPAPAVDRPAFLVTGRCAGQRGPVHLWLSRDDGQVGVGNTAPAERALARANVDRDGRFTVQLSMPQADDVRIDIAGEGCAPVSGVRPDAVDGEIWDLGIIDLMPTSHVRGIVVDRDGAPIAAVHLMLVMIRSEPPPLRFRETHRTESDAAGRFAFPEPLAAGDYYLAVDGCGGLIEPRRVQVGSEPAADLRVVVERPDPAHAIHGRVVDARGRPVAGVGIVATGEGAAGGNRSGPDGAFVVYRSAGRFDDGKPGAELAIDSSDWDLLEPRGERLPWGKRDVQLVVQPLASLVVRPVGVDGAPVEGTLLAGRVATTATLLDLPRANVLKQSDGSWSLRDLRVGEHVLFFVPAAGGFAVGGPLACAVNGEATPKEVRLVVPPASFLPLRIVRGDGSPVADSLAEVLVSATTAPLQPEKPAPGLRGRRGEVLRGQHQFAVAQGRTDASGQVRLQAPAGRYLLRLTGCDHRSLSRDVVIGETILPQTIVVEAAASVRGQLGPPAAWAALAAGAVGEQQRPTVSVRLPKGSPIHNAQVAADGSFVLGPLPSGGCVLTLHCWLRLNGESAQSVPMLLGNVEAEGTAIDRHFDLSGLLPATVRGTLSWNDAPFADGGCFVRRREPSRDLSVRVRTDAAGRFQVQLPPGEYDCQLALPSDPGPGYLTLPVPDRLQVSGPGVLDWAVSAHRRELRLQLLDQDGSPLANRRVRTEGKDGWFRPGAMATDDAGQVAVAPAPYGPFFLWVDVGPGDVWRVGPLEIPADSRELVHTERRQ